MAIALGHPELRKLLDEVYTPEGCEIWLHNYGRASSERRGIMERNLHAAVDGAYL